MALPVSILKKPLNLNRMHIESCEIVTTKIHAYGEVHDQQRIVVKARPFVREQGLCPICKKKCIKDGFRQSEESSWRAPNLNGMPVHIVYRPQRIHCEEHGSLNEFIPWADGTSRFTAEFNNEVAWLVCQMNKSAICELMGINWRTVGNCVKAAHDRLEPDVSARIHDKVRRICVDESSYKKGHKYITIVYDMDKNRVIWVHEGFGLSVFEEFCKLLSPKERENIEIIAGDGAKWIDTCKKKYFPNAIRCVDFFHVVQWATEALDKVRISTAAKAKREYDNLKDQFAQAEAEAAEARLIAQQKYLEAVEKLASMPNRGRPSKLKMELKAFISEYESILSSEADEPRPVGRPKKERFSKEHDAALVEFQNRINDVKGAKYALGHNPENCSDSQNAKLQLIQNSYPDLYQAYQLKESLRLILHMKDSEQAEIELQKWIESATESGLHAIVKLAEKIERYKESILNSIKYQANSAKSESTNTTVKGLIKLARGFRNIDNLIALIYLKCSDIVIPLSNRPQPSAKYLRRKRERANELRRIREEQKRLESIA